MASVTLDLANLPGELARLVLQRLAVELEQNVVDLDAGRFGKRFGQHVDHHQTVPLWQIQLIGNDLARAIDGESEPAAFAWKTADLEGRLSRQGADAGLSQLLGFANLFLHFLGPAQMVS